MKVNYILIPILSILISCSSDQLVTKEFSTTQFPQKWQLIQMTGSVANVPPATGSDMDWQESYVLNANGTFVKTRDRNGEVIQKTGTYTFDQSDETYIIFTYLEDNEIIGNCSSDPEEWLMLTDDNTLQGTWWACDGPGLFYKRVN